MAMKMQIEVVVVTIPGTGVVDQFCHKFLNLGSEFEVLIAKLGFQNAKPFEFI